MFPIPGRLTGICIKTVSYTHLDVYKRQREYLQVGQYTEIYFPGKGVRFIAVNDGVDSLVERCV